MIKRLMFCLGLSVQPFIVLFFSGIGFSRGEPLATAYVFSLVLLGCAVFIVFEPGEPDNPDD